MKDIYKDKELSDEDIERALDFMEDGGGMTDEQTDLLLADDAVARAAGDLLDMKQAAMESCPLIKPDADKEWEAFRARHAMDAPTAGQNRTRHSHTAIVYALLGVAATLLAVFAYSWMGKPATEKLKGDVVLAAVDTKQSVKLETEDGDEISLDDASDLAEVGAKAKGGNEMTLSANAADTPQKLLLTIPRGQTFKLALADGSEVWLNTDSRLVYPSRFAGKDRRVRLEGEAYFKISHDAAHPFIVETGDIETKVLGTEFNVRAYNSDDTRVTLIKGSVEVCSRKASARVRLTPGKEAALKNGGGFSTYDVDTDSYVYWNEGFFYFDNVALEVIAQDIGRWYNMNVVFQNEAVKNYKMHFLCDRKSGADHAVHLLNSMGKVKITRQDNTLYIK